MLLNTAIPKKRGTDWKRCDGRRQTRNNLAVDPMPRIAFPNGVSRLGSIASVSRLWGERNTMKKSEAALLVTLPLGAPWYLWHGYPGIAAASMNAAFAVILGAFIRGRRDAGRKLKTLGEAAKSDGRYVAQHIEEFMQADVVVSPGGVPGTLANF